MTALAGSRIDRRGIMFNLVRKATGGYVSGGDYVRTDSDPVSIKAILQPVSGRQAMDLPEGIREEARYLVWSRSELLMEDVIDQPRSVSTEANLQGLLLLNYMGIRWDRGQKLKLMVVWPRPEGASFRAAAGLIE
jgi:hypothetical protein